MGLQLFSLSRILWNVKVHQQHHNNIMKIQHFLGRYLWLGLAGTVYDRLTCVNEQQNSRMEQSSKQTDSSKIRDKRVTKDLHIAGQSSLI
jgi:hypothetical protein